MKTKMIGDVDFSAQAPTHEEIKALAEATATMLADKTNTIIAVMPNKDGKPVFIKITKGKEDVYNDRAELPTM
jgi:hypothetical protein